MINRKFALICLLLCSTAAFAQETCGIGTAVKKFNRVDSPISDDFAIPLKVITNNASTKVPFSYCDAAVDLRPGISFLNVYLDSVLSTGRSLDDPAVVSIKRIQDQMKAIISKGGSPQ
jgi:hypothetical protein